MIGLPEPALIPAFAILISMFVACGLILIGGNPAKLGLLGNPVPVLAPVADPTGCFCKGRRPAGPPEA
jgi:hypothetical protein